MQKLRLLLSLGACLLSLRAAAQQFAGTITDARTGQGIPFANVGVLGKSLGTVSGEQGSYHLTYQAALAADTVRISSLGYQPRQVLLRQLLAQPNVALAPTAVGLGEVSVQAKNPLRRARTLGFTKGDGNTTVNFHSQDYGAEVGTRIQLRHQPTLVQSATFCLAKNQAGKLTFRVNIYRVDADGKPTNVKLLTHDIIVTTEVTHGSVVVDLSAEKLVLQEDFFLALEWIKGSDATQLAAGLSLAGGLGYADNDLYFRQVSQAKWERASIGALLLGMQPKLAFFVNVKD
ncbi:MAG: carboxypeptidase-like regulatory domain-containing protein [Janthinobacterium lividum]